MSELKSVYIDRPCDWCRSGNDTGEFYLKSEADKVIAELKDIDSKNRSAYYKDLAMIAKDIERHKYKRCLKNREICVMRFDIELARQYPTRCAFWSKWERKWLELAEKFKESK